MLKFGQNPLPELLGGNVDAVNDISPFEILKIKNSSDFNRYHEFNLARVYAISWNHRSPFFHSASTRRALTQAIDREELKQFLDLGQSIRRAKIQLSITGLNLHILRKDDFTLRYR